MAEVNYLWKIRQTVLGIGDHLVAPIQQQFKYMCCFGSNIKELEAQLEMFQSTRQGVQLRVDNDRANRRIIDPNVEAWLSSANEVTSEVEGITQEKPKVKEECLNGWCPNLKLRYSLSRKAVKNTELVVKLQAAGISYTQMSNTHEEIIPNGDFTMFESRMLIMEQIINALKHDEIKLIGICGLGGTGKTTMVKEVAKRAKEDSLFDEVAMVVVSQEPDLANVQACIADMLGLKDLRDTKSPLARADLLRIRLLQDNKKILVILDDIWAEMDLEAMGFPLRANKNFKILYTSQTRSLWHNLKIKKEIPLEQKKYKIIQEDSGKDNPYERELMSSEWNWDTPDCLILTKERNDLVQLLLQDGVDSLQQLRYLKIKDCDTPKCLADTRNPVQQPPNGTAVFPILEKLSLRGPHNLREICHGPLPVGSFGQLTEIDIHGCERLRNLFHLPIVECLAQLKSLSISWCEMMEEVFIWEEQQEDVHVATNNSIEFPKLETLELVGLPSLVSFCRGIAQIDLPQLKELQLQDLRKVNRLFHSNNNLSSNSKQNDNIVSFLSLFPQKVSLPKLEVLLVSQLENLERLGHGPLLVGSLSKLRGFLVRDCGKLLCVFPSQLVPMLRNLEELTVERCNLLEAVFELEGVDSNEPNLDLLSPLKVVKLHDLPRLIYIPKRHTMGFKYIQSLDIYNCNSLSCVFAPPVTKSIPQLHELKIQRCEMLSTIVAEENGVDEVEFPQLERLELIGLPNLMRFCNSTNLELPLLTKINISFCPSMDVFSLGQVSAPNLSSSGISWNGNLLNAIQLLQENGDDLMATSMEKPRILDYVTGKSKSWQVAKTQCRLVSMPERIDGPHKVARLLYTNSGNGVLALGCNGSMRLWKCGSSKHNPIGKATASVVPQQWQPASSLAMTNDLTGAKLEEVVPCIALSKDDSYVISAHGGVISLFNMLTFKVMTTFMPPPPASTFLAFYPQDNNVIAIGMEDSTIRIYNISVDEVKFILEGHKKRITGLAFSTDLNILVSSGADAQICIWSTDTWKKLKSVPIHLPTGKARNGDTRVQFHSNQLRLLVSQETQLAIYDASKMDRICQWVPQDVFPAPISCATYSCDSQLVYVSFCDGNIGVFDADNLTVLCRIAQSKYLSPALLTGRKAVYPLFVAAHPQLPNQFAIGLTDGLVIVIEMEPPTITGLDGGTASSSKANDQTPDQKGEDVDLDEDLDDNVDEDADVDEDLDDDVDENLEDVDVDEDLDNDVDKDF